MANDEPTERELELTNLERDYHANGIGHNRGLYALEHAALYRGNGLYWHTPWLPPPTEAVWEAGDWCAKPVPLRCIQAVDWDIDIRGQSYR